MLQERVARRAAAADGDAADGAEGGDAAAGASAGDGEVSLESLMAELDAVRTGRALPPATVVKVRRQLQLSAARHCFLACCSLDVTRAHTSACRSCPVSYPYAM